MTTTHHHSCITSAIDAIADNNGWTLADAPGTLESELVPETEAMAIEWLANGNVECKYREDGAESLCR